MSNPQEIHEEKLKNEYYQKGYEEGFEDGERSGWQKAEDARADYANKHGI